MAPAKLTVDFTANAAYLRLCDEKIATTREVAPGVLVDLDAMGVAVGVEVLDLDVMIPYADLKTYVHVRQEDLRILDLIRPSVTSFVARQSSGVVDAAEDRSRVTC